MLKIDKFKKLVSFCKKNKIFLHIGTGNANDCKKIIYENIKIDDFSNELINFNTEPLDGIFSTRSDFCQTPLSSNTFNKKPFACTWWSNGTWLFDRTSDHVSDEDIDFDNIEVLVTSNPKNILEINTREEFIDFCNKYSTYIISENTNIKNNLIHQIETSECNLYSMYRTLVEHKYQHYLTDNLLKEHLEIDSTKIYEYLNQIISENVYISIEEIHKKIILEFPSITIDKLEINKSLESIISNPHWFLKSNLEYTIIDLRAKYLKLIPDEYNIDYSRINWDLVKENGYYGVYFGFCKLAEIGCTYEEICKYSWHDGLDVESLIVWDSRAYNQIFAVNLLL
jgi:hypothetical protein